MFEAKRSIVVRDLPAVLNQLQAVISQLDRPTETIIPIVAGRYLAPSVRQWDVVFDRVVETDGLRFVAPSQAAVDLLTAPGRGPAEGQALLDWMDTHEADWQR